MATLKGKILLKGSAGVYNLMPSGYWITKYVTINGKRVRRAILDVKKAAAAFDYGVRQLIAKNPSIGRAGAIQIGYTHWKLGNDTERRAKFANPVAETMVKGAGVTDQHLELQMRNALANRVMDRFAECRREYDRIRGSKSPPHFK